MDAETREFIFDAGYDAQNAASLLLAAIENLGDDSEYESLVTEFTQYAQKLESIGIRLEELTPLRQAA